MNPQAVLLAGFEGTELPKWLEQRLRDGLAGVCLFATNVASTAQLRELTDAIVAANPHAIIAIDEEGGDVTRLYQSVGSPFVGNAVLGRLDDASLTFDLAQRVGLELAAVGVNVTFAPDADVNSTALNPVIGVRSFGDDPELVARHTSAWVEGLESTKVASCAKHFPGHGDTVLDSHVALPRVDAPRELLDSRELLPFAAAITAGARTIMTSHLLVPALDPDQVATFSRAILRDLLRAELGFKGVVVSDALDMAGASAGRGIPAAAVAALVGGCDLLCIGTKNTDAQLADIAAAIDAALADGTLGTADFEAAAARVSALGRELAATRLQPFKVPGEVPGASAVKRAFDVSSQALATLERSTSIALVRMETQASIAVGESPWGPWGLPGVTAAATVSASEQAAAAIAGLDPAATIVAIGRDNHRHPLAGELREAAGARDIVFVDMGWPERGSGFADIATYGASKVAGAALLELVTP